MKNKNKAGYVACVGAVALICSSALPLHAQVRASTALFAAVTMVTFNEAQDSTHDAAMIWQAVQGAADDDSNRLHWLRAHSSCATGVLSQDQAYARPGNCAWVRNLQPAQTRLPRGFRGAAGTWHRVVQPKWARHVTYVRELMRSDDPYRPCAETPTSWDGVRYGRDTVEGRGHRVLECDVPYVRGPDDEGLHNFATVRATPSDAS